MKQKVKKSKRRFTWKWVVDIEYGDFALLCPHAGYNSPYINVLLESKTFRKEKFGLLVRLEYDRIRRSENSLLDSRYGEDSIIGFCDSCDLKYEDFLTDIFDG